MNTEYQRRTGNYTRNISAPSKTGGVSLRGLIGLLLAILLPPVGIFFLWNRGVFRTRGRVLLTGIATLEMGALVVLLTPHATLVSQLPVPMAPPSVTAAPIGQTVNALTNLEELLYQKQLADALASGGTAEELLTEQERLERINAENEVIFETVVYSVFNNAKYYHADSICGNQTNGRTLTVREALREGLGACPNCNPPSPAI